MNTILRFLADLLLRLLRSLDPFLLLALLALMGVGLATLYSASNESARMTGMQGAYFGVGLAALWAASRVPAHILKQATPVIFAVSLLPMVLVLFQCSMSPVLSSRISTPQSEPIRSLSSGDTAKLVTTSCCKEWSVGEQWYCCLALLYKPRLVASHILPW